MKLNNNKWVTVEDESGDTWTIRIDSISHIDHDSMLICTANDGEFVLDEKEFKKFMAHLEKVSTPQKN